MYIYIVMEQGLYDADHVGHPLSAWLGEDRADAEAERYAHHVPYSVIYVEEVDIKDVPHTSDLIGNQHWRTEEEAPCYSCDDKDADNDEYASNDFSEGGSHD